MIHHFSVNHELLRFCSFWSHFDTSLEAGGFEISPRGQKVEKIAAFPCVLNPGAPLGWFFFGTGTLSVGGGICEEGGNEAQRRIRRFWPRTSGFMSFI